MSKCYLRVPGRAIALPMFFCLFVTNACAEPATKQAPSPEEFLRNAKAQAIKVAGGEAHARIANARFGTFKGSVYVVCGRLELSGELTPFMAVWETDRPVQDDGLLVAVPIGPNRRPAARAYIQSNCDAYGLGDQVGER